MTADDIEIVFDKILAMYPTTKFATPQKNVVETWQLSNVLREFPWQRRGDLLRMVQNECDFFPNLAELAAKCKRIRGKGHSELCDTCGGDRHVPVFVDDEPETMTYTNKHGQVHTYAGAPIRYSFVVPCPNCNTTNAEGRTTLAGGGA